MQKWNQAVQRFWKNEEGIGTLEIVLIIAVIIVLALLFKGWIIKFLKGMMDGADDKASTIFDDPQ